MWKKHISVSSPEKKAEAYAKYNNAAIVEMLVGIMPQMAAEIAKPLSSIDKVNIYGTGGANGTNGSGVSEISGNTAASSTAASA